MNFTNLIQQDSSTALAVRLKWFPLLTTEEYISKLPPEVQVGLCPFIGLGSLHKPTKELPDLISMRVITFHRYEAAYYQQLWNLLHEYEFRQGFKAHEDDAR